MITGTVASVNQNLTQGAGLPPCSRRARSSRKKRAAAPSQSLFGLCSVLNQLQAFFRALVHAGSAGNAGIFVHFPAFCLAVHFQRICRTFFFTQSAVDTIADFAAQTLFAFRTAVFRFRCFRSLFSRIFLIRRSFLRRGFTAQRQALLRTLFNAGAAFYAGVFVNLPGFFLPVNCQRVARTVLRAQSAVNAVFQLAGQSSVAGAVSAAPPSFFGAAFFSFFGISKVSTTFSGPGSVY